MVGENRLETHTESCTKLYRKLRKNKNMTLKNKYGNDQRSNK